MVFLLEIGGRIRRGSHKKIMEESKVEWYYKRLEIVWLFRTVIYVQHIVRNNSSMFRTTEEVCRLVIIAALHLHRVLLAGGTYNVCNSSIKSRQ